MRPAHLPLLRACGIALLTLAALGGCGRETPPSSQHSMTSTDLNALGQLIHLPVPPRAATFEKVTLGRGGAFGPTDWELIAVLEYEPETLKQLALQPVQQEPEAALTFSADEMRPWFPAEVKAAFDAPEAHGASHCRGEGFDAAPFAKSPLLQGVIAVPQGTHHVVLRMQTS